MHLYNLQERYNQKDYCSIPFFGGKLQAYNNAKKEAVEHLLEYELNDHNVVTEGDKKILNRSPQLHWIYKHLAKEELEPGYQRV